MASKLLSTEQQNFARLGIGCVDLIKLVLKDILRIQIQPKDLFTAINSCLELTTVRYKLRPEQQKICFIPPPLTPDYEKFDVSLLYTLIRDLCPTLKPTQGWGKVPKATNKQIGDDIERLRILRNGMFPHLGSTTVPDSEFTLLWKDLQIILPRTQAFVISKKYTADYEKELSIIEKCDFGMEDMEKYKILLEGTMLILKQLENERVRENDTGTEKYKGSSSRRLVIQRVSKEDEGEYQAVLLWKIDDQTLNITSNPIFFKCSGR
ncbi:uncharacterized protein LOC133199845 [Saccostrea echinata]|uniref:uncharacterized protein LOC133199845 n=1 Tax=Saccostrea echinata TaxID=191078 RepID=UPI002A7F9999|nr:uncharacterized protein LOC133199845 [Saccostrea echinata]